MDQIDAGNGLSFRIGFTGHSGHLYIEPSSSAQRHKPLDLLPDYVPPPAFLPETPESIQEYIKEKYLVPRLDPDEFSPQRAGRQWEFDWFDEAKVKPEPSLPRSTIVPRWELPFRRPERWEPKSEQVDISELTNGTEDSGALPGIVGPAKDFVKGSLSSRPFRPGGLDDSHSMGRNIPEGALNGEWVWEMINGGPAQSVPPGLKSGIDFGDLEAHSNSWVVHEDHTAVKTLESVKPNELSVQLDDLFKAWEAEDYVVNEVQAEAKESGAVSEESFDIGAKESISAEDSNAFEIKSAVLDEILAVDSQTTTSTSVEEDLDESGEQQIDAWVVSGKSKKIEEHFNDLVPDLALDFPFELDPFQKEAIYYLEKGDSVFVAAHTSAGKTVLAEYAFALATRHCTRAVYTAPIKTISNQKYRDFCGKFDVGLLTGDVSLRPEASCLIMTTEILRSMLYRGADIIRDIEWVIFDEVHYVNDVDRGVVWEEVIIMLPRHINFVLLSATVPNTIEFASWIGRTKKKQIRITGTTKRPVPLEHCLFYSGELYKVCENEIFISQGLKAAKEAYKKKISSAPSGGNSGYAARYSAANDKAKTQRHDSSHSAKQNKHSGSQSSVGNYSGAAWGKQNNGYGQNSGFRQSEASMWRSLINKLSKKSLLPVVIFCFSKNRCDKSADNLTGTDLTSSSEKSEVRVFCDKAFSRLKGSDRNLPQIVRLQSLLHRGLGVHHAGLLPIVKEVVEMLFCRGLVKVLFSTETFAMGVNAPARTVAFDSLRKFDGKEFRQLLPGEYTQMAGRAGRRGLDKIGTVLIVCHDEVPEERDLKRVIVGSPTRLESQFRLTYIMILHLLRVEELKVEEMLKRSFAEFHAQKKLPEQQQLLMRKLAQPTKPIECIKGEPAIEEYYGFCIDAETYSNHVRDAVMQSPNCQQFLCAGRVVVVKPDSGQDHLLGVVVKPPSSTTTNKQYIVLVLKPEAPPVPPTPSDGSLEETKKPNMQVLLPKSKRGLEDEYYSSSITRKASGVVKINLPHHGMASGTGYEVRWVDNKDFLSVCNCKLKKVDQVGLLEDMNTRAYSTTVQELLKLKSDNNNEYPPPLDPVKDLKLKDTNTVEAYIKLNSLLQKMSQNKCHGCVKLDEHKKLASELRLHRDEVNALRFQMSDEALQQMPDFQGRIDVLKEIGCIDEELVVQIKGRVACEMNSGEELICTECLFDNQMDDLEPEEAVAIMSAFVFQQKNASEPSLTPKLFEARQRLCDTATRLGLLQARFNVQIDPGNFVKENLKFGLVEVVYEWAKGTPFAEICELTDVPEGLIVRTIVRLDETCCEFKNASLIMGNSALQKKWKLLLIALNVISFLQLVFMLQVCNLSFFFLF